MFRVTDQLAKAARVSPRHFAATCAAGMLSLARRNTRVQALASTLHALGLTRGDRLAHHGFNRHVGVECLFAAPLTGRASLSQRWPHCLPVQR